MKLAKSFENADVQATHEKPQSLYPVVVQELRHSIKSKFGPEYFMALWSEISPTGNIYRYNGYVAERRRHCEDIRRQMSEIADECAVVLGDGKTNHERLALLIKALGQARVNGCPSKQTGDVETPTPGFPPLQEFVDKEVRRIGPLLVPVDVNERTHHQKCISITFFVFVIQMLAPTLVFLNRWRMKSNYMRDPATLFQRLTLAEAFCLGGNVLDQLRTVMGVAFIVVIVFFVRMYVSEEVKNARKSSRLPTNGFWMTIGILANMSCCVMTVCAIPLLFWSEETPTNIVLDAMTMLFVFKLDDLSEFLGPLVGMSDNEFQRVLAWNTALLAQCPVNVRDIIDTDARKVDDLWCIKFDSDGNLLSASGLSPCETRLVMCSPEPSEATELMNEKASADTSHIRYRRNREETIVLPSSLNGILTRAWCVIDIVLLAFQFLLPPVWWIVNKPCFSK